MKKSNFVKDKDKFLSVVHVLKINNIGGIENLVIKLINAQKEYINSCGYIIRYRSDKPTLSMMDFSYSRFKLLPLQYLGYIFHIIKLKPNIIHNHSGGLLIDLINIVFFRGRLLITHNHGCRNLNYLIYPKRFDFIRKQVAKLLSKFIIRISVSNHNLRMTWEYEGRGKYKDFFVPNGISFHADKFHKTYSNNYRIGFVGRFEKEKRIERITKVVDAIIRTGEVNNYRIVLAGVGSQLNTIHQYISESGCQIDLIKKYSKFENVFSQIDVLVHTSEYEAFGLTILEGLVTETPVIISDKLIIDSRFEDFVTRVDFNSSEQVINSIQRTIGNLESKKEQLKEALPNLLQEFSFDKMNNQILDIYRENMNW